MIKKLLLITAFSSLLLAGNSDRLQVNLNTDENGNTNPDLFIPIYWNSSMFSGIGHSSSNYYEISDLSSIGLTNSRIGTVVDEKILKLNLLTYELKSSVLTYGFGAQIEQISIDKQEFGYFELSNDIVATENSIEIELFKPSIVVDASYRNYNMFVRFGMNISPITILDVEQTTLFQPLVSDLGQSNSSTSQDIAYDINFKAGYKVSSFVSLIVQSQYSLLPMKYDLAVLNNTGDGFVEQEIEIQESTISSMIKLTFNIDSFSTELSPSIGYGTESASTKDISRNESSSISNSIWMIGFEGKF